MLLEVATVALTAHRPADAREAAFQKRMLELLRLESPFSRATFAPGHFTASAFVISPREDELLLIFHRKLGIWVQPGGHIEPSDESLLAAARREVAEEVGLTLPADAGASVFDIDIHPIPARKDEPAHEHFDVRYSFRSPTRELAASDEVADARWVPLAEVDSLTRDESVQRAARKLRALPELRVGLR